MKILEMVLVITNEITLSMIDKKMFSSNSIFRGVFRSKKLRNYESVKLKTLIERLSQITKKRLQVQQ